MKIIAKAHQYTCNNPSDRITNHQVHKARPYWADEHYPNHSYDTGAKNCEQGRL